MNILRFKRFAFAASAATLVAVIAACAPKPDPVLPPPVARTPQAPYPPMGAAANLTTPRALADGTRLTVNHGLTAEQAAWNLRSAYNVAALNCQKPKHASILSNYAAFLKANRPQLASINRSLDKTFKAKYGGDYIRKREAFQTRVYNYFALPPVIPAFCDAALVVGRELRGIAPSTFRSYAPSGLARLESVYRDFFDRYDRYRADLTVWEARYGMR
ncbi:MAG: hypothetical protein KUG65_09550 [Sphingomonadaceae bacterium]|nr:hypothetical protein [Sphingomonadaceae bacterium]